ncbi:unnamed protein product [Adineta ricciae]|uniref:Uncharacterized protein n=1 Tax=Adineta ricciae TaxID=249248 RepID=A0A814KS07_ADIRI|nr:unnamed protein product [Adineta ricciae]CAF1641706.1 unnamed protein product [Adineta ricciae]
MNRRIPNVDQLASSHRIETLQDIVRNCQRNEQRLLELERHTRHERKRAERLLREKSYQKQEESQQKAVKFFITLDNDPTTRTKTSKSCKTVKQNRVRFDFLTENASASYKPKVPTDNIDNFDDLARRCEDLLLRLRIHTKHSKALQSRESFNPSTYSTDERIKQTLDDSNASHESLLSEIQRRNYLRTEILRLRLQQHLLLPGRPNTTQ